MCPSDLLASLSDGRLMRQLPRLVESFDLPYLVLLKSPVKVNWETGRVLQKRREWEDSPWGFHHLNSIMAKFEAAGGKVRFAQDMPHLAGLILSLYQYHRKVDHRRETFVRRPSAFRDWGQVSNPVVDIYERLVDEGGRGIGVQRALRLAEEYPRPQELRGVGWEKVARLKMPNGKQFGPVNAKKVMRWLG